LRQNVRYAVARVYHTVMAYNKQLDDHGARVHVISRQTPNGTIAIEVKVTCSSTHPTGITTAMLRDITAFDLRWTAGVKPTDADFYIAQHVPQSSVWTKGSRQLLDKEQLKLVAQIYATALRDGMAPTKVIQTWAGSSRPTASRWIYEARQLGLIGKPVKRGLAGNNQRKSSDI